jgi:hypothetical protein
MGCEYGSSFEAFEGADGATAPAAHVVEAAPWAPISGSAADAGHRIAE